MNSKFFEVAWASRQYRPVFITALIATTIEITIRKMAITCHCAGATFCHTPPRVAKKIDQDKLIHLKVISRLCDLRDAIIKNLDAGTVHGNTQITNIDVLTVLLASYFNPTCRSLRLIEQLSELDWAKDRFGVKKFCK